MLKITVLGASGRMGRTLIELIAESKDLELVGALTEPSDPDLGTDAAESARLPAAGVLLTDDCGQALRDTHVAIDFTLPEAMLVNVRACVDSGTPLVMGTTGLEQKHMEAMTEAARDIPLVFGRNMSVGVNVFTNMVRRAAAALGKDYDVEIREAHHQHKVDAPSGTALALGEAIASARGTSLDEVAVHERYGAIGPRIPGTIGFSVVRAGDIVGDHEVLFVASEESVEFRHNARDRKTFARGALRAARWVAGQPPGLYGMTDVLGLDSD